RRRWRLAAAARLERVDQLGVAVPLRVLGHRVGRVRLLERAEASELAVGVRRAAGAAVAARQLVVRRRDLGIEARRLLELALRLRGVAADLVEDPEVVVTGRVLGHASDEPFELRPRLVVA